jgi:hypothetical protein
MSKLHSLREQEEALQEQLRGELDGIVTEGTN